MNFGLLVIIFLLLGVPIITAIAVILKASYSGWKKKILEGYTHSFGIFFFEGVGAFAFVISNIVSIFTTLFVLINLAASLTQNQLISYVLANYFLVAVAVFGVVKNPHLYAYLIRALIFDPRRKYSMNVVFDQAITPKSTIDSVLGLIFLVVWIYVALLPWLASITSIVILS